MVGVSKRLCCAVAAVWALILTQWGGAAAQVAERAHKPVDILVQQKLSADDGTQLAITVWKPQAEGQRFPTVLVVTPYVSDEAHGRGRIYADRGYVTASLDPQPGAGPQRHRLWSGQRIRYGSVPFGLAGLASAGR